jgi:phage terminase Nu1 subunit (DNA packaging protein)
MNKTALARKAKVSLTTINAWLVKGIPHTLEGGQYVFDWSQVQTWRKATLATRQAQPEHTGTLNDARLRKELALAGMRELQLREREGQLIEVQQCKEIWANAALTIRSKLLAMPTRLALQLVGMRTPGQAEAVVKVAIYETLNELSRLVVPEPKRPTKGKP